MHNQGKKGSRSYKSRNSAEVNITHLSDDDSYDEGEIHLKKVYSDEEGYFFSSDSD